MCIANSMEDYHSGQLAKIFFPKCRSFIKFFSKTAKKWSKKAKNDQKKFGQKMLFSCYRDLALAVSVVLHLGKHFSTFHFRVMAPPMRQNVSRGREDFLSHRRGSPTKTAVTRKRKVEKCFARWQNDRNGEV